MDFTSLMAVMVVMVVSVLMAVMATVAAMVAATGNKRHPPHAVTSGIVSMQHLHFFLEPKVME